MRAVPVRLRRGGRRIAAGATLAVSLTSAAAFAGPAASASQAGATEQPCPAPQVLVAGTHWVTHRLAPGVVLREGVRDDRTVWGTRGEVDMHVLRVDLSRPSITIGPLVDHLAERQPLSVLAANRRHLVAATNTGFFDFYAGAPSGPVISGAKPLLLSTGRQPVIGFTGKQRATSARAWLVGSVRAGGWSHRVMAVNYLRPHRGLAVYTPAWGQLTDVPRPGGQATVYRMVRHGAISGGVLRGRRSGPSSGELLVASAPASESWLRRLRIGAKVTTTLRDASTSRSRLLQGYNVGKELVQGGKPARGLDCNERDTQAARTGVGFARGGRTLIIAVVADRPCWSSRNTPDCRTRQMHGLDHKEMARLMIELGAQKAWQWDGSGSSELIARMPGTDRLEIRNYCADGEERPMPVGFGIYSTRRR